MKLTLFDVDGDAITGITIRTTAKDADGKPVMVPGLAYQWVPRVPPKVTWAYLALSAPMGGPLARAASEMFAAAVSTVAAPEIDFAALPNGQGRPQAYDVWCWVRLASGERGKVVGDAFFGKVHFVHQHVTNRLSHEEIRAKFSDNASSWYDLRDEVGGTRVALWNYFETQRDGRVDKDPVVGLMIESNGPVPAVRWTFRPGVRKLFRDE